jgi:hypothetical protein
VKTTAPLFEVEDRVVVRPRRGVARVVVEASEDNVTGFGGIALVGELLDRLGVVEVADRHHLRPIGPGGYSGGECYRPIVELQLAGGDFLSDVSLLFDEATRRLRGSRALPSHTTLFRFLAGADLGRVMRAQAVNREMLKRAWAMGAAPVPGRLTIDPDATYIDTYGKLKEGSRFSYKGEVQMSPLVGVVGETGDVLAVRARGGNTSPRRKLASFIDECVAAIPTEARPRYELWIRIDSAGFSNRVVETCVAHNAIFTITAEQNASVREAICALAMAPRPPGHRHKTPTASCRAPRSPRLPTPSRVVTCVLSCAVSARRPGSGSASTTSAAGGSSRASRTRRRVSKQHRSTITTACVAAPPRRRSVS